MTEVNDLLQKKLPKKTQSITKTFPVPCTMQMEEAIRVYKATVHDDDFNRKMRAFATLVLREKGFVIDDEPT